MADNYTEVTNTSWFSRLGNSFGGIGAGLVMIALATFLLYWNEGRAVRTGDAIAEAQMQTVALPGISTLDSSYDGKLVYATGRVVAWAASRPPYGLPKQKTIMLSRWMRATSSKERCFTA